MTLAEPVSADDRAPAGETAPSIAAEITPEVQWRMDQCRAGRILHAGGPYVKNAVQGLLTGPEEQLREVLSYYSFGGPLHEAARTDFEYALSIRQLVSDQLGVLEDMAGRYVNPDDVLGHRPPDYSDEYQEFLFSLASGDGAVPGMRDRLAPEPSEEALSRVAQIGDESDYFPTQWMASQIGLTGTADDARMFLLYGGVPTIAPEAGTPEFELGVEELKARWASCDSSNPLIDLGGVLTEQVSVAHQEWAAELASQREQRDVIGSTEVAAFVQLIRAHEAMIGAVTQAWWADYLLRWQRAWTSRPTTYPRYPTQQEFTRAASELSTARTTAARMATNARTAANAAAQQATTAQNAQQEAADIAAAAGYPEGRGLAYARQAVQVVTASAAAANAAAYAAETARSAAQASAANSATLLSLAQTRAHAVQTEFRRAAAEEAAEQARSAAASAAAEAEAAEAEANRARSAQTTAEAAEAEAAQRAASAREKRETAESQREIAAEAREAAAAEQARAADARVRAEAEQVVAAGALEDARESGGTATDRLFATLEAEGRAREARETAEEAERNRQATAARAAALEAAAAAAEGTESAAEARAAANVARVAASEAANAASEARSASDEATTAAARARAEFTRANGAAERARANANGAMADARATHSAAMTAHAAAAEAIDASERAAVHATNAEADAAEAAQGASTARENATAARQEANAAQEQSAITTNHAYATALAATAARDAATAVIDPANEAIALGTPYQESDPAAGLAVLTGQAAKTFAEQQAAAAEAKSRAAAEAAAEARRLAEEAAADARAAAMAAAEAAEDAAAALESVAAARASARAAAQAASAARAADDRAQEHSAQAYEDAYLADAAARAAEADARAAGESASEAEQDAGRAREAANAAERDSAEARDVADIADSDATAAEESASNAQTDADAAEQAATRAEDEERRELAEERAQLANTPGDPDTGGTGYGGSPMPLDDEALLRQECGEACVEEYRAALAAANEDVIDWLIANGGDILLEVIGVNDLRRCLGQGNVESCLWSIVDAVGLVIVVGKLPAVTRAISRVASGIGSFFNRVEDARRTAERFERLVERVRRNPPRVPCLTLQHVTAGQSGSVSATVSSASVAGSHERTDAPVPPCFRAVTAGANFKDHWNRHRHLLARLLDKTYPRWKVDNGLSFLEDVHEVISSGRIPYVGMGTLRAGQEAGHIYRGEGITIVLKQNGEFWTLLESGKGMDTAIRMVS
ncbi:hypothetical protein [Streptomyces sp. NPDC127098]|uniref:hypothetical protein n=1 Tax=Streptomyces sp. NPDC127098 TaxID=3347137 RepID=UPI0036590C9D